MWAIRKNECLWILGCGLILPTFVRPIGIIQGFDIETQHIFLARQDAGHLITLLVPCLGAIVLLVCRRVLTSVALVFCISAISLIACIDMVFLYFHFHFAEPDPTWVAPLFLLGYTLLFLGHLKNLFFPYDFLRAYQPHLPERLQAPVPTGEIWGAILLIAAAGVSFQGYFASQFLGKGVQYLLIIVKVIELTPLQRVQMMLGAGLLAAVVGMGLFIRSWRVHGTASGIH